MTEAIACYERALEGSPDHGEAYNNLGSVFKQQGQLAESLEYFRKALLSKSDFASAYSNLGTVLQEQGQLGQGHGLLCEKPAPRARVSRGHYNRAMIQLCQENFSEGGPSLNGGCGRHPPRGRSASRRMARRWPAARCWSMPNKGLGDTLMFVRYLSGA